MAISNYSVILATSASFTLFSATITMHLPTTKPRLSCALIVLLLQTGPAVQAQTIQRCTQADGSVLYQQDVCPPGSNGKAMAVDYGAANILTLSANGAHQYSTTLTINGVTVTGQIDTGATFVTLSTETANRMRISTADMQNRYLQTANGIIGTANVKMAVVKVGKFDLYNVEVAITPSSPTLIGMSALSQLKFANENGNLVLSKR